MGKKSTKQIDAVLNEIQGFLKNKPNLKQMFEEIQMMKFKIHPIQGNILSIDLKNDQFIEALWNLGKLDEFFHKKYPRLSTKNKEIFTKIFDNLYQKYQYDLNRVSLLKKSPPVKNQVLEVEIFKERNLKKVN